MIPEEMHPALMGVVPATIITSNKDGVPNITNIARIWFVDSHHVAIANHMLNKSIQNLRHNRFAFIRTMDTNTFTTWELDVEYEGSNLDGAIFTEMKKQYEVLSMMLESGNPITVKSAEVFQVLSVRSCDEENSHLISNTDLYNPLLEQLEKKLGWDSSGVWIEDENSDELHLVTIRGMEEEIAATVLKRVAQLSLQQKKPLRILNIRSQFQYAVTTFLRLQDGQENFTGQDYRKIHQHFISLPLIGEHGEVIAVIACQSNDSDKFRRFEEEVLESFSRGLAKLIEKSSGINDENERLKIMEQELEHVLFKVSKQTSEVKIPLSPREIQVAIQVAKGLSNDQIAQNLFISKRTVTTHLKRIYQKLEIGSRAALTKYVHENGLTESST
ncbi:LuxR C-terminal-related transcriptional regulator [Neobacillus sp. 114]|uniref:LuxR C-terminal-related transcriptional regulator n=1 Tax=Neobacillus sp. 114 TaxID=3048535 RepID=UPI0024C42708|nr:LuxR C-terminal-related transcriptional regulator [Neobacillus sp. 114]